MGRGGTNSLWSSGMTCRFSGAPRDACRMPPAYQTTQTGRSSIDRIEFGIAGCEYQIVVHHTQRACNHQGYRDKPHGQLVLVSLTHYCASTPSLSTSWSRTTL